MCIEIPYQEVSQAATRKERAAHIYEQCLDNYARAKRDNHTSLSLVVSRVERTNRNRALQKQKKIAEEVVAKLKEDGIYCFVREVTPNSENWAEPKAVYDRVEIYILVGDK